MLLIADIMEVCFKIGTLFHFRKLYIEGVGYQSMDNKELLESLFDRKTLKILKFFFQNQEQEYGIREISKLSKVPLATAFRISRKLVVLGLLEMRKVKNLKLYRFCESDHTAFLEPILEDKRSALSEFVKEAAQMPEIFTIILHGKEEREKASLLIIGEEVDQGKIKELIVRIKERYNFNIRHLTLLPDQFDQMSTMGLYPGKKIILYEK